MLGDLEVGGDLDAQDVGGLKGTTSRPAAVICWSVPTRRHTLVAKGHAGVDVSRGLVVLTNFELA